MTATQSKIITDSGYDSSDFYVTSEGWSHNGFVAWQLETASESKREDDDDAKIAAVLRALDDEE